MKRSLATVWVASLVAAGLAGAYIDAGSETRDTGYFLGAAQTLLSGRWLQTFADKNLQAGPLQVAGLGASASAGHAVGMSTATGVATLQALVLMALVLAASTALASGRRSVLAVAAAAVAVLATSTIHGAYASGHPAEVAIPALWVLAGVAARRRHLVLAGILIGLSAGFETWGVLAAGLLLVEPRRVLRGLAAFAGTLAVLYGPFIVFGTFRMGEFNWPVVAGSLPALLGHGASFGSFGWPLRALQGGMAALAGAAAVLKLRRFSAICWLAPLLVIWVRLALDPMPLDYYLLALETVAILGAAHALASATIPQRLRRHAGHTGASGPMLLTQNGQANPPAA